MLKFKVRKIVLTFVTLLYILLTIIEMLKYLFINRNIFGLVYLLLNLFIIFLLVPTCYNYKKHYSKNRISKFIIIFILGLFCSFLLDNVIFNIYNYIDSSNIFIDSIWVIKNIFKPIIYVIIFVYVLIEKNIIKR